MTEKTTVSRRTVAKGLAWSVPAVAVAAATPAYAASPICIEVTYGGDACKEPGNASPETPKAYNLSFVFTNTCNSGCVDIVVTDVYKPRGSDRNLYLNVDSTQNPPVLSNPYNASQDPNNTFQVCAGTPVTFTMPITYSSNSSNGVTIAFTVNGTPATQTLDSPPDCA